MGISNFMRIFHTKLSKMSCQVLFLELFILTSNTNHYICNFIPATLIFKETACITEVPCHIMEHAFNYLLIRLCILQLQPPYHTHFTSSSLWNLGHQVVPLEKKRDDTGSVPDQCCYNTCSKISQQKHSSCYWPVSRLCGQTLSCWSKTHFFVWVIPLWHKAITDKLAENNTTGGKHTMNTSLIMFSMICCKVLWLTTQIGWMSLCHIFQFNSVTQNQFLVKFNRQQKGFLSTRKLSELWHTLKLSLLQGIM